MLYKSSTLLVGKLILLTLQIATSCNYIPNVSKDVSESNAWESSLELQPIFEITNHLKLRRDKPKE